MQAMLVLRQTMRINTAAAAAALLGLMLAAGVARAETTLRLGKAQPNQFAFVPADVGVDAGIFKKHGIDLEISAFAGDAKEMQALTAGSIDIALGGGPAFATIVKGVPMKAVAAEANAPNTILLVVLKDGPIQSVDDLKGRTVSVSTAGSLTYWLTQQLAVAQGWGDNGIKIAPLGSSETQIAALKTHQIDGATTDGVTVYRFMETGDGRILVKYGDRIKDFHVHVIYASDSLIAGNPEALKAFLAGWFETIAYMRDHRQQTIDIAVKHTGVSSAVATSSYDDTMPILSSDGHFSQKALDVLATSFVDTQALPSKPDMSTLLTEAFLPK
jgi:ABC-type nitrate/sulfonate/bicarbonate transport system substrate-binding protein